MTHCRPKIAILVSAYQHCHADLLYRLRGGDLACDMVMINSNHSTAKPLADFYRVPFHHPQDKRECEREMPALLA